MKAIERFNPYENKSFSTYAEHWIKAFITRDLNKTNFSFSLPLHHSYEITRYKQEYDKLSYVMGRSPTYSEVAQQLGVDIEHVKELERISQGTTSIDGYASGKKEDLRLIDILTDDDDRVLEDEFIKKELSEVMEEKFDELNEREREVIRYRFFCDREYTFEEIAVIFGLTKQRVHQNYVDALRKLRSPKLKEYLYR